MFWNKISKQYNSYFTKINKTLIHSVNVLSSLMTLHNFQVYVGLNVDKLQHLTFKIVYIYIHTTNTVNRLQVLNIEVKLQGKTKNNFWALYCCYHFYTYAHVLLLLFPTLS